MRHPVQLCGAEFAGTRTGERDQPTLLRFLTPDFVPALLQHLPTEAGRDRLAGLVQRARPGEVMVLDRPVHRAFNLVVVDASCLIPGEPRLDPAQLRGAGFVLRRETGGTPEGWCRRGDSVLGWHALPPGAVATPCRFEPDGVRRAQGVRGANRRLLALLDSFPGDEGGISEDVQPLFPAPPEVCAALGRTVLYGFVGFGGDERSDAAPPPPPFSRADVRARIPAAFRPGTTAELPPSGEGAAVTQAEARAPDDIADATRRTQVQALMAALTWLAQETGAFTGDAGAAPLVDLLSGIAVEGTSDPTLYGTLARAQRVLIERRPEEATSASLPRDWPQPDAELFEAMAAAAEAAMQARWSRLAPAAGRFDEADAVYHLRCFIRVDRGEGCPPALAWGRPSPPFRPKPWYESGDAPPALVELPPLTPEGMARLKPNVAFKVPPELQQFMDRLNLKDVMDGKAKKSPGLQFGMICGFSIPIITICAFIVLQIFLVLFHILFFWLPFIRICIPFPAIRNGGEE
jgi:hypothetical protein